MVTTWAGSDSVTVKCLRTRAKERASFHELHDASPLEPLELDTRLRGMRPGRGEPLPRLELPEITADEALDGGTVGGRGQGVEPADIPLIVGAARVAGIVEGRLGPQPELDLAGVFAATVGQLGHRGPGAVELPLARRGGRLGDGHPRPADVLVQLQAFQGVPHPDRPPLLGRIAHALPAGLGAGVREDRLEVDADLRVVVDGAPEGQVDPPIQGHCRASVGGDAAAAGVGRSSRRKPSPRS